MVDKNEKTLAVLIKNVIKKDTSFMNKLVKKANIEFIFYIDDQSIDRKILFGTFFYFFTKLSLDKEFRSDNWGDAG